VATPWRFLLLTLSVTLLALPLKAQFKSGDAELPSGARMDSSQFMRSPKPKGEWALVIVETPAMLYCKVPGYRGRLEDKQRPYAVPRLGLFRHLREGWAFAGYVDSGADVGKCFSESQKDQLKPACYLNMAAGGEVELFMNIGIDSHISENSDGDVYHFPDEPHPKKVWGAVGNQGNKAGTKLVLTNEGILKTLIPTNPSRTAWKEDGWRQGPFLGKAPKNAPRAPECLAKDK
jgi:hypothetical protein